MFREWLGMRRARLERFGAIVQLAWPRALVFVDRALAKRVVRGARWTEPESELGEHVLSAPLEAHLQLTNRCGAGCQGCYTGASPDGAPPSGGSQNGSARSTCSARPACFTSRSAAARAR